MSSHVRRPAHNQLPAALARFLEAAGLEERHVIDLGLDAAEDRQI